MYLVPFLSQFSMWLGNASICLIRSSLFCMIRSTAERSVLAYEVFQTDWNLSYALECIETLSMGQRQPPFQQHVHSWFIILMIVCSLAEFYTNQLFNLFFDTYSADSHTSPGQRALRHTCLISRAFVLMSSKVKENVVLFDNSCLFYVQHFLVLWCRLSVTLDAVYLF